MKLIRCRTCCYPTTKPDLFFDETGRCSACINYANRPSIDWEARHRELLELLDRHHGECLVPSSGGKDSHAQALILKNLGADVMTVTATTCHLTEIGRMNLDNLARHVPGVEYVPNKTVRAKLNRLGLEMVGDMSWPEHASIFSLAFRAALDLRRPLVFMGECPQQEYGGPRGSEQARQLTHRWISEYGGFLGLRASDFVGVEGITERDMRPYAPPSAEDAKGVEVHFLGSYQPWSSRGNAVMAEKAGMIQLLPSPANWWDFENQDNAQCGPGHDFLCWVKYGYGRGCAQISVDIRAGLIHRDEALEWVERHDGIFPWVYAGVRFDEVLDRIGMTRGQFDECVHRFTNKDLHRFTNKDLA